MAERRAPLWRLVLSWLFLLIFCLAAPAALVAGWARLAVIDGEVYARTVSAMAADGRVQNAVGRVIAARVQNALAGENPTATEVLQSRVVGEVFRERTADVVASEAFRQTWEATTGSAHRRLVLETPQRLGEPVTLDFSPLLDDIEADVADLDVELPPDFALDAGSLRFEVLDAATADRIRLAVARADVAFAVALAVTALALILSIALAPERLAAMGLAGFGLAIAMVALIAVMLAAQEWVMSETGAEGGRDVIEVILDAVSQGLRLMAVGLALLGLLLAGLFTGLRALGATTSRRSPPVG
ncbi:MAG: hypothetical protein H0T18_01645 [Chloroflexia bacterium]|nr:hypothetical protein [Chloroflexia bacterium]